MNDEIKKEIETILKKHGFKIVQHIYFPQYRILPDEVELALKILSKHGMKIQLILEPIKEK